MQSPDDLKLAPFHLLASERAVHTVKDHVWHMQALAELCRADEKLLLTTPHAVVDVTDPASQQRAIGRWEELTGGGGKGVVVKPFDFVVRGRRGPLQPAIKCRGPEYLCIIYGPEYGFAENLERLRSRGLCAKRSLALQEFALGLEALQRFVRRQPLYRVHECVFGVLALESEPVDPRLQSAVSAARGAAIARHRRGYGRSREKDRQPDGSARRWMILQPALSIPGEVALGRVVFLVDRVSRKFAVRRSIMADILSNRADNLPDWVVSGEGLRSPPLWQR